MISAISTRLMPPRTRSRVRRVADRRSCRLAAVEPAVEHEEDRQHAAPPTISGLQPEMLRGPEEIDAAQEADEQRRIAERRQRAADIGDEDDEEHHDMHVVRPRRVGAEQRPDQDHRGAGGADDARHQRAEREQSRCSTAACRAGCR